MATKPKRRAARRRHQPWWVDLDTAELLEVRLCDLHLRLEGTALMARVERLRNELRRAGLRFRPHVWLSTSWFSPDGVPGFAMPFFLAHPRLARLERRRMLEIEGGSLDWCMKLMRHEAGHALDNAYRLHRRKSWRECFGPYSQSYASTYRPRPTSRRFVVNLDHWYAQSHPAEDWAECFAVWLQPGSLWRRHYAGWPALRKLEYVDSLMGDIKAQAPQVRNRSCPDSLAQIKMRLGDYYERKQKAFGLEYPGPHDDHLLRLFVASGGRKVTAAAFLRRHRLRVIIMVAQITGQHRYVVDQVLRQVIASCVKLGLRLGRSDRESLIGAAILLTTLTMTFVRSRTQEFLR
ncbi:MAG: putative zinc-binding metallopeptidase [Planctomycetota bacterium]